MYAIQAQDLTKQYKNGVQALSGLNLSVRSGEIFSLLGQNGAGKSTLIKILTTYLKPTYGNVTMLGKDIYSRSSEIRSEIACVSQNISIDTHLSLEENMMFQSRLYKIPKAKARNRIEALIADFGLQQYIKYPVSRYSGGIKRRLDIALNMVSNPKILFMDEPTVGMDVQSRISMWEMMKKIRNDFGTTIFLTTHYLYEADNLSDTICIMKDGKEVIQSATPSELRSYINQDSLQIQFSTKEEAQKYLSLLKENFIQMSIFVKNSSVIINTQCSRDDMEMIVSFLLKRHISFNGVQIVQPTLEDIFLLLTSENEQEKI